jgi:hypothetical protein
MNNKPAVIAVVVVVVLVMICIVAAPALIDSIRSIHVIPQH